MQKKIVAARLAGFACFGFYLVGLFLPKGAYTQALMLFPFAGVVASTAYIHFVAKCPKCKVKLPQQRFGLGLAENLRTCPGCGLDLTAAAPPAPK
jgi:hypothetical protein